MPDPDQWMRADEMSGIRVPDIGDESCAPFRARDDGQWPDSLLVEQRGDDLRLDGCVMKTPAAKRNPSWTSAELADRYNDAVHMLGHVCAHDMANQRGGVAVLEVLTRVLVLHGPERYDNDNAVPRCHTCSQLADTPVHFPCETVQLLIDLGVDVAVDVNNEGVSLSLQADVDKIHETLDQMVADGTSPASTMRRRVR